MKGNEYFFLFIIIFFFELSEQMFEQMGISPALAVHNTFKMNNSLHPIRTRIHFFFLRANKNT
jgi:hypothetical protein